MPLYIHNDGNDRGSREEVIHFMREGASEREGETENKTLLFLKCRKKQCWTEEIQNSR
jgi:hypothetical protein